MVIETHVEAVISIIEAVGKDTNIQMIQGEIISVKIASYSAYY